jgi:hypothetical protein
MKEEIKKGVTLELTEPSPTSGDYKVRVGETPELTSRIHIDESKINFCMSSELKDGLMNTINNLLADVLIEAANKLRGSSEPAKTSHIQIEGMDITLTNPLIDALREYADTVAKAAATYLMLFLRDFCDERNAHAAKVEAVKTPPVKVAKNITATFARGESE